MKKKFYKYGLFYIGVVLAACADNADLNEPTGSTTPPSQVLNATVKNLPGAAIIYYDLPDDQNLKYVRASYKVDNMIRTVNASFYTDSLVVEGFPTKGEYDVELYSVSYGEAVSTPLVVKVSPDTPPYQKGGDFYVRGLDAVTTDFGIFVRDRWGHLSDTLYVTETPLYEEQCDKSLFRKMALPTDSYECHSWNEVTKGNDMTRLWDGITDTDPCFQTKTTTVMPQWFTFDMGEKYKLSRFVMVSRYYPGKYGNTFKAGHPKHFELWGSNDPNPDGSFDDSWVLLSEYESVKPSGGGVNDALTTEDQEAAKNGENFIIPDNAPAVRYIRFKTNDTWGKTRYMHLHELTFFGARHN